ncbi:MAG: hypothetical protein ABIQ95_12785 [Bdellovibrionia bacterium]
MKNRKFLTLQTVLALATLTLGISGCKDLPAEGNYRGSISYQLPKLGKADKIPVLVELTYSHHHLKADILNAETHVALTQPLMFSKKNKNTLALEIPDFLESQSKTILLKKVKTTSGQCYRSDLPGEEASYLCFDADNFNLNIQGPESKRMHLYGTQFKAQKKLELEEPQSLTVLQGVDRILAKNYDVQESLQLLLRANEIAHRAYLNMLPHTSLGGLVVVGHIATELLEGQLVVLLEGGNRASNDLISFIFPGRWFKAKQATWEARAQKLTNTLFQINMGTSVQSMSVALHAHRELRDGLQELQKQLAEILKISQKLAGRNKLDPNTLLTLEISLSDLDVKLWQAQNQYMQDRMALSQILAFENPETIENMMLEEETTPLEKLQALSPDELEREKRRYSELALNNSFELRQLEYLHRAAVLNQKNMYVEWMDTASTLDLGFKLIPESKILKSMVKSIEIKSEKTRQSLIVKTYNLVRDRDILRQSFDIIDTSLRGRKERLNLLLEKVHQFENSTDPNAIPVQPSEIRGSVTDVAAGLTGYFNTRAAILMDQTELDRIALKGVYEKFLPHLEENEIPN